jgi:membrane protease YdiL (CAAX protease family)
LFRVLKRCSNRVLRAVVVLGALLFVSAHSFGQALGQSQELSETSPFRLRSDPERIRSDFWIPLSNLFLPGLDQWWEGQYAYGALYSSVWLGGNYYASLVSERNDLEGQIRRRREAVRDSSESSQEDEAAYAIDARDETVRKYMLGQLLAQGASGFSVWHSFRSAVRSRQSHGQYAFLAKEETPLDLLSAPLHFEYLTRATTFIPLAVGAGLGVIILNSEPPEGYEKAAFRSSDAFFTTAYSLNAGTHEEAFFRGYLMPVMSEYWGSPFLANLLQSSVFALAHISSNTRPLPQFFLGLHLGSVSQRRDWTLSEAVFIHTWWDIIAFGVAYHYKRQEPKGLASVALPVLWLPPFSMVF